jgi:cytochrome b6-f complex iron-sulfur subunit
MNLKIGRMANSAGLLFTGRHSVKESLSSNAPDSPLASRRGILRFLLTFSIISTAIGVMTPILGYLWPPTSSAQGGGGRVLMGTLEDIPPGSAKVIPLGTRPVIIVHDEGGEVHGFSAVCTHLACVVGWDVGRKIIACPCHDARFSGATGAVISGPAPAPLPSVDLVVEGDEIFAVT